jgi:hypothetical protein
LAGACYTSQLNLSILAPAVNPIPSKIKRISILPMPGPAYSQGGLDSLRYVKIDPKVNVKEIKMGYLHGIFNVFSSSPWMNKAVVTDSSNHSYKVNNLFYLDELKTICEHDTTDFVLILTHAIMYGFYNSYMPPRAEGEIIILDDYVLLNRTKWAFVDPYKEEIIKYEFNDTLSITGGFVTTEFNQLLYDNCYRVGQNTGEKMIPHWRDVNRIYFIGPGRDLKDASVFVAKDYWYNATRIWNDLAEGTNKVKASRAAFNMALAFEQKDDLIQAVSWITYADSLRSNTTISAYKVILHSRLKLKNTLDAQFHEPEN